MSQAHTISELEAVINKHALAFDILDYAFSWASGVWHVSRFDKMNVDGDKDWRGKPELTRVVRLQGKYYQTKKGIGKLKTIVPLFKRRIVTLIDVEFSDELSFNELVSLKEKMTLFAFDAVKSFCFRAQPTP
jgi:hypothetical protein